MRQLLTQRGHRGRWLAVAVVLTLLLPASAARAQQSSAEQRMLSDTIFRELVTLPYYGVFDHLAYEVGEKGTVTLHGQVRRPTLKSDAEARVKNIEGVEQVNNKIEVLPVSPNDDGIRLAAYRAIYRHDTLERYALNAVPPIHIIVKNGAITLEGRVDSKLDKQLAEAQARSVAGTFDITNNLTVDK